MRKLTADNLQDILLACHTSDCMQIGIAFSTHERLHDFAMAMRNEIDGEGAPCMFYARGTKHFRDIDTVWFESGSNIRLFDVDDPWEMRGRRFDLVLYDDDIKEELLEALKYCERPNHNYLFKRMHQYVPEDKFENEDTKALDDFLNEFIK